MDTRTFTKPLSPGRQEVCELGMDESGFFTHEDDSPLAYWDLGKFWGFPHRSYNIGHEQVRDREHFDELLKEAEKEDSISILVRSYEHSMISFSTGTSYPFDCRWDASVAGVVIIPRNKIKGEISDEVNDSVNKKVEALLKDYTAWMNGWIYVVIKREEHLCDRCDEGHETPNSREIEGPFFDEDDAEKFILEQGFNEVTQ